MVKAAATLGMQVARMMVPQRTPAVTESAATPRQRRERRPVTLAAVATREDGSMIELTIVDLSYDGCCVSSSNRLTVGETLSLSVLRRGSVPVTVRWADGARAGLSFASVDGEHMRQPRQSERVSVEGEVVMGRTGKNNYRVHIYDLSPEGCKAEFVERPELNERLWIKFDSLEPLGAEVRWIVGSKAGVKFLRSFHPAVFDLLIARLNRSSN
jgi:hypothetical protein